MNLVEVVRAPAGRRVRTERVRVMLLRAENVVGIAGVVKMKTGARGVTELGVWKIVFNTVSLIVVICKPVVKPLEKRHVL